MKKKKILLTGFPGWLGSRFMELVNGKDDFYRSLDCDIRCIIHPEYCGYPELKEFSFEKVIGDITKKADISGSMVGCDYVIHAAGIIHPKTTKTFYKINTVGTQNIIEEAKKAKIEKFIYISSNSPFGHNQTRDNYFNELSSYKPYMVYGRSKLQAELVVKEARSLFNTIILRACWFYGTGQPKRQIKFLKMIQKGRPLIFGKGDNIRSMTYIDNLVQAIVLVLKNDSIKNQEYWIADDKPYSMNTIYLTISKIFGVERLKPITIPTFVSKVCEKFDWILQLSGLYNKELHVAGELSQDIACSVEKAKMDLKYSPNISLEEGMKISILDAVEKGQLFLNL